MCYSSGPSGQKLQHSEVLGLEDLWSQWSLLCCKLSPLDQCDILVGSRALRPWEQKNHIHSHNVLILVKVNSYSFLGRNNPMESTHHEVPGWSSKGVADWFLAPIGWIFSISFGEQKLPCSCEFTYSFQPLHYSYVFMSQPDPYPVPTLQEIVVVFVSPYDLVHQIKCKQWWEILISKSLHILLSYYQSRGIPRPIFWMVYTFLVQIVHLCSRGIWVCTVALLLWLSKNFIKHLFHHDISSIILSTLHSTTATARSYGSSKRVICITTWTCHRAFPLGPFKAGLLPCDLLNRLEFSQSGTQCFLNAKSSTKRYVFFLVSAQRWKKQ